MFGKDSSLSAGRWRGFLISGAIHALAAGLIFLAVRHAPTPSKGTGFQDTLAPDTEVTITMWDEPVHIGTIGIKPILVKPSGPPITADTLPLLKPIDPTAPIVPQPPAPIADPNVRPADYVPAPPLAVPQALQALTGPRRKRSLQADPELAAPLESTAFVNRDCRYRPPRSRWCSFWTDPQAWESTIA